MEVDPSNNDNIPLLTMSLELDNGLTEQINIYRNSDPETLAFEFCKEHNLELDSVNYLKEQIQKLLNETKEAEDEEVEDEMEEEQIEEVYEDEGTEDSRYEGKGQEKGSDDIKRREEEIHQLTENNQIDDDIEIGEEEDEEGGEGEDEGEVKGENDVNEVNDNDNDEGGNNNNNGTIPENPEDEKDVQEEVNVVNKDNNDNNDKDNETPLKIEDLLHTGKNEYKQHLGNDNVHDKEDVNEPLTNEIIEDHHHHQQEEEEEQEQEEQCDVIKEHDEDTNSFHKDNIEIQEIQDLEDNNDEQYNDDNDNDDTNNNIHNFKENQPKELEDEDYDNINEDNILHNNNNPSLPPSNTNIIIDEPKQPSSKDNNNIHNLPDHPSPPQQNQPQDSLENTEQDDELPISQDNNNNNNYNQPYRHHHHHIDEDEDDNDVQMVHHTQPLHHQMEDNIHSDNSHNNNTHHTASNTVKNNNNIFNRLFQDAEIKRVMPKRPCHFNNRNNNNNNNNTNNSGANNNSSANTNNTNNTKPKKQTTTTTNNNNNVVVVTNNPTNTNNYGEYLYEQHKLHKQEQLHRNEEDKRESQNKELTHCTFKPNINNTNNNAFTSSNNNNNNSNINNYNYYYNGKQVQTIGTNNTSIRPRTPMTRAEKLEKEFNEKHTFKPQINSGYTTELNFLERQALHMQKCKDNIENYKQMLHQQQQQQYDNAQQQRKCRSKPRTPCYTANNACCVVGGGEYNSTTFANTNVFDRNYNYANQYKKKLIELTNMYNNNSKTNPNMTNTQFNVNNNKIIDRVNCEAFSNLFKVLDSDEDGVISQMHMNTKKLSPEVYRIIEPIINEIKEENQKLEESDFVDAMCNLYEDIRYYDRHLLINTFKNIKNTKIKQHITNNNNTCSFNHNYKTNNNTKKGINIDHQRKDGRMLLYKNEDKKYNTNYTFKPVINANAHKYAKRYDEKQQQMYNKYLSLYNSSSSNKFNSNREKGGYINRAEYFKDNSNNSNNNNMNFNSLRNCTFDNYVKNLH